MLERKVFGKEKYEGFFFGLYKRNEMFLIASAVIFLSSMFAGYFLSSMIDQFMANMLRSFKDSVSKGEIKLTTLSIFLNNLKIAFFIYGGGIIFGIATIILLAYNGLFIGYAASKFPIGNFIVFTLPHGIFEITGIIIAGAAGLRLASTIINIIRDILDIRKYISIKEQMKQIMDLNSEEFRESITLLVIAMVLILIGAFIEANFTVAWGKYIIGLI